MLYNFSQLSIHRKVHLQVFGPRGCLSAALAASPHLSWTRNPIYAQSIQSQSNNNPHSFDTLSSPSLVQMLQSFPHHHPPALLKKRKHELELQARAGALSSTTAIVGPVVPTPQSTVVPVVTSVTKKTARTTEGLTRSNAKGAFASPRLES